MARLAGLLVLGCALAAMICSASAHITHIVGEDYGWQVPETSEFYQTWASQRKFGVGDKLVFTYSPGSNNVIQSKHEEFDACTQNCPIGTHYLGPTTIELTHPGDYFFISSFGKHCEYGQKLHISVCDPAAAAHNQEVPTRHLLSVSASPVEAPAPSPSSAPATTAIGAAAVFSGIMAALLM